MNLCGLARTQIPNGKLYLLLIIDGKLSKFSKALTFMDENETNCKIKCIRSENGEGFTCKNLMITVRSMA